MTTRTFDFEAARTTVLVLEDEDSIRMILSEHFSDQGFRVLEAANGKIALDVIAGDSVGIALIDKNLPGEISGIDVLGAIPTRSVYTKSIIVTGFPSTDSAVDALRLGAFDYITKPFNLVELTHKVARAQEDFDLELERDEQFNKHATLFETVPGIVWFMTEQGILKRINRGGAELLGYDAEELKGQPFEILLPEGDEGDAKHVFSERRTGDRAKHRRTIELRAAGGDRKIFEIYSAGSYLPVVMEDQEVQRFCGTVGVAHDITEQVRLEEMLQRGRKLESLGRLARGVAHDFNNVLAIIMGSIEIALQEGREPANKEKSLREALEAGDHAAELVKQLLAFGRDETVTLVPTNVGEKVEATGELLRRLIDAKVSLEISCDPAAGLASTNTAQLQQVLLNLAANARDSMPEGGTLSINVGPVTLERELVTVFSTALPGSYVRLSVADTGAGIPAADRDDIFDPFFTTKQPGQGTGLGLATVLGIVQGFEGHLRLDSVVGKGTTIDIFLPRIEEK